MELKAETTGAFVQSQLLAQTGVGAQLSNGRVIPGSECITDDRVPRAVPLFLLGTAASKVKYIFLFFI